MELLHIMGFLCMLTSLFHIPIYALSCPFRFFLYQSLTHQNQNHHPGGHDDERKRGQDVF